MSSLPNSFVLEDDLRDFLDALNQSQVKYILVGGYAVLLHGYNRFTIDMDIWVEQTSDNYQQVIVAFQKFGMPTFGMSEENFLRNPEMDVFTYGRPPLAIDVMVKVKGLEFESAYAHSEKKVVDGLSINVISKADLFKAKRASARLKDLLDIEQLGGEV
jgi:hypothetical protein